MVEHAATLRTKNPFRDPLVTELIELPQLYKKMFSERILIGETLEVFGTSNVVLLGPQGAGKSMILNLLRCQVLAEWISQHGKPPATLRDVRPFLGISINLVRANVHAFGRRSVSKALGKAPDPSLDATAAADYINHYLLREFLRSFEFLASNEGSGMRKWLGIKATPLDELAKTIASWDCWVGYYTHCSGFDAMLRRVDQRINAWIGLLNANDTATATVQAEVWDTKSNIADPMHLMGNLMARMALDSSAAPTLFVVIDQYEELPRLNEKYGTELQRIVNTLVKSRDPVVFYKVGARTYDWGRELRIWGSDSRIEVWRDYSQVNLTEVLMRKENTKGALFEKFARDVAIKRIRTAKVVGEENVEVMFGPWNAHDESQNYSSKRDSSGEETIPLAIRQRIASRVGAGASPLEKRLASAWCLQCLKKKVSTESILAQISKRPWKHENWSKERKLVALLQLASRANQKKLYYGWNHIILLSGANITAYLLLCGSIWDWATKMDHAPLDGDSLPPGVQTEGVQTASRRWRERDQKEAGGRFRYHVLSRIGPAIRDRLLSDQAISNPGHSGFSLDERELWGDAGGDSGKAHKVREFLHDCVSWAVFEERPHTSKNHVGETRRKFYLHPLLSPVFGVPHIRVKEPLYVNVSDVYDWVFGDSAMKFAAQRRSPLADDGKQLRIPM